MIAAAGVPGVAIEGATLEGEAVGMRAVEGLIVELGPGVRAREGDDVIDAGGMALVAGLTNAHTHAAMTLFRGYADDLPLMEWLERHIWPAERRLEPEDVYWATRLACLEMIRSGTVRFWDMYWHAEAVARAVADSGMRAVVGPPLLDPEGNRGADLEATVEDELASVAETSELVSAAIAPHSIYAVGEGSLRWVAERAGERGLAIHIHLSETREEVERCLAETGLRPAAYLDSTGALGPSTVLAHGVWLDDEERDLIAERGATLVTNPVANMKLGVGGVFDYPAARERGIPVGLGTDGAGSNNSLDLLSDVKTFALAQKHSRGDAAAVTAPEALAVASGARSRLTCPSGGELSVGAPADVLLVRSDAPELSLGTLEAGLVYSASGAVVDTTVVAGKVLMRGREAPGAHEVVIRARERAARLGLGRPIDP